MEDIIEDIPKTMEKFFACKGKMVKASPNSVKTLIQEIQIGELVTLDSLKNKLAKDFNVQAACPASITKALKILSKQEDSTCYWRVIKKNGELIKQFPGGFEGHSEKLINEGFDIDLSKKNPIVIDYRTKLVSF